MVSRLPHFGKRLCFFGYDKRLKPSCVVWHRPLRWPLGHPSERLRKRSHSKLSCHMSRLRVVVRSARSCSDTRPLKAGQT